MFDFKIFLILVPVWLGVAIVTLWTGFSLPRSKKTVERLFENKCRDEKSALTLSDLGLPKSTALLLRRGSSLRRVVDADAGAARPAGAAELAPEPRYYIRPENDERARKMFCAQRSGIVQSLIMLLIFTASLVLIWIVSSLIFDTQSLKLPFGI